MKRLPDRPDLDQLKKQAKDLLAAVRRSEADAVTRMRESLTPQLRQDVQASRVRPGSASTSKQPRLHDAQLCLAREYGFSSWPDLSSYVAARRAYASDRSTALRNWLALVYAGDLHGSMSAARPVVAARMLAEYPDLLRDDAHIACAIGDAAALRAAIAHDASWVNRPGGLLQLPPLIAVAHSSLIRLPQYRDALLASVKLLLDAGADPNQAVASRSPPASLQQPSEEYPLSALYGAAGQNRDPAMTQLLLDAGADPNDNESLYHSLENPACTRLLLAAGARVTGSNALYRVLDMDDVATLRLLLASGGDANERAPGQPASPGGNPLLWAIRRGRSAEHVKALLDAGADPATRTRDGTSAYAYALRFGLTDVAELLKPDDDAGADPLNEEERFIAACAAGDEAAVRQIQSRRPDLPQALPASRLRQLPELAALGNHRAVAQMLDVGWPIAVRGGDWEASALNHAVFRGDAELARLLLSRGATWREEHGFGDNVCGTLSWASLNEPDGVGDWPGCAEALLAHDLPPARYDPAGNGNIIVGGQSRRFSDAVTDILLDL